MDRFELPHARLFFVIHDLHQKKQITISERSRLKGTPHAELVVTGDAVIFSIIAAYDQTKDVETLYTALVKMIRSPRSKPAINIPPKASNCDESASPLDTFLQSRKKGRERYPRVAVANSALVITETREEGEPDDLRAS